MQHTIGLVTTGGDCAGLNAAIRAVVMRAAELGHKVIGLHRGLHGIVENPPEIHDNMTPENLPVGLLQMGGTMLGASNRSMPGKYMTEKDGSVTPYAHTIFDAIKAHGITAMVMIGGDGSFGLLGRMADIGGWNAVFVPKTIDNDVVGTEAAIGFDSAVAVATEALDRLRPTAASHDRVMVLEVMGRDAGHIALASGIAGGADVILIPELPYDFKHIVAKLQAIRAKGRKHALVVVSEAVNTAAGDKAERIDPNGHKRYGGIGDQIATRITAEMGWEARAITLGHMQRGTEPTHRDRLLATAFGAHAVDLVHQGKSGRMVGWSNGRVIDVPVQDAIGVTQRVDMQGSLVATARGIGICLGDGQ
ncbi:MAG: ATP-dependent 6-phosphofructokinase [Pseudomonadota bacterium]